MLVPEVGAQLPAAEAGVQRLMAQGVPLVSVPPVYTTSLRTWALESVVEALEGGGRCYEK